MIWGGLDRIGDEMKVKSRVIVSVGILGKWYDFVGLPAIIEIPKTYGKLCDSRS